MFMSRSPSFGPTRQKVALGSQAMAPSTESLPRGGLFNPQFQFLIVSEYLVGDWLQRGDYEISQ